MILGAPGEGNKASFKEWHKKFKEDLEKKEEEFDKVNSKNKAIQLEGILGDAFSVYSTIKLESVKDFSRIHLISEQMQISNELTDKSIKKILKKIDLTN